MPLRDDLSPREIVAVAMKRNAKRARRRRREEASIDAPDYHALKRRQEATHQTMVKLGLRR